MWLLLALLACDPGAPSKPSPAPSRVDAVKAPPPNPDAVKAFCDVYAAESEAKPFVWPPMAAGAPPAAAGWRWVNIWATWCGPCVAEMPMLARWTEKLASEGRPVELTYVSFDAGQAEVERFKAKHPGPVLDLRISGTEAIAPWLAEIGLDAGTAIPIHGFVDPQGRLRCVRTGALAEDAYSLVKRVLAGE